MTVAIKIIIAAAVAIGFLGLLFVLVLLSIEPPKSKPAMTPDADQAVRLRRQQFQKRADKHRSEMWKRLDAVDKARYALEGVLV